jgi:hypothetical protein
MPSRWEPSKPRGRGIFAPGTRMAVHRGDQRAGQGILPVRDGYPLVGGAGLVPHPFLIGFGTAGQGRSRQRFRQQGIGFRGRHHHPGMVGGIYPEMVREVPKAEPRFGRNFRWLDRILLRKVPVVRMPQKEQETAPEPLKPEEVPSYKPCCRRTILPRWIE